MIEPRRAAGELLDQRRSSATATDGHRLRPDREPGAGHAAHVLDARRTGRTQDYLLGRAGERPAEPLNHVQSAYFGHLARAMAVDGVPGWIVRRGGRQPVRPGHVRTRSHNAGTSFGRLLPMRLIAGELAATTCDAPRSAGARLSPRRLRLAEPPRRLRVFAGTPGQSGRRLRGLARPSRQCFGATTVAASAADRPALARPLRGHLGRRAWTDCTRCRLPGRGGRFSAGLWATLFQRAGRRSAVPVPRLAHRCDWR